MLRRLETGDPVDMLAMLHAEQRGNADRPWVMLNMVTSVDGATALRGGATELNDPDDRALFLALRSVADLVLMGAQTVRSENVGPVRMTDEMLRHRADSGFTNDPRLAMVTRSVDIDPAERVFSDPSRVPLVIVPAGTDDALLAPFRPVAEIVESDPPDGAGIIDALGEFGVILCEGGPTLNSQLIAAGLVDEINLTVSPVFGLGESKRLASGPELDPPQDLSLERALAGDRSLFLRYVRV